MRTVLLTDSVLLPDAPPAESTTPVAPITLEQTLSFVTRTTPRRETPAVPVPTR